MGKTTLKTVKLMKEAYKDKPFGESMIFRWHNNFEKRCLSSKLTPKSVWPESGVNDQNVNTIWSILQENLWMTYEADNSIS